MREGILEAFAEFGFDVTPIGNVGFEFTYEATKMLCFPDAIDEDFFSICIPRIYELEKDCPMVFMDLINRINSSMKYIKAYPVGAGVWLCYERELLPDEDLLDIIPRIIIHLDAALALARKILLEIKTGEEQDEVDEYDDFDNIDNE